MTTEIVPFNFGDHAVRTLDIDHEPWFVAADVCAILDIGNSRQAVSYLDADERSVITNDGRPLGIVSEAGLYSLVLRSRKPEAKTFKRWVTHEVLPAIRKHGQYGGIDVAAIDRKTLAQWVVEEANRADAAEARVAELEPVAQVGQTFIDASGDFSVREAAQILCRDHHIATGQTRLFATLKALGWIQDAGHAYQRHIDAGRVRVRTDTYFHPRTGEPTVSRQIRVTPKGIADLHKLLGQRHLAVVGSTA